MDDVLRVDVGAPPGDLSEDGQREVRQRRGGRVVEEDPPLERVQEGPAIAELLRGEWAGRWDALTPEHTHKPVKCNQQAAAGLVTTALLLM